MSKDVHVEILWSAVVVLGFCFVFLNLLGMRPSSSHSHFILEGKSRWFSALVSSNELAVSFPWSSLKVLQRSRGFISTAAKTRRSVLNVASLHPQYHRVKCESDSCCGLVLGTNCLRRFLLRSPETGAAKARLPKS